MASPLVHPRTSANVSPSPLPSPTASAFSRLANFVQKHARQPSESKTHSRTQSEESDWYVPYNAPSPAFGRAGGSGSSGEEREVGRAGIREARARAATAPLGHATNAMTTRPSPSPHLAPPPSSTRTRAQPHPAPSHSQKPSFASIDASNPGIAESPRPPPLKPIRSPARTQRKPVVVPFYSTGSTYGEVEMPLTPPMQGDFGYATVYPPVRVSVPISPPQEPTRLPAHHHPYATYGYSFSSQQQQAQAGAEPRRARSSNSLLSSYNSHPAPPLQPSQYIPRAPPPPAHALSATASLAAAQLDVPPFRISHHPGHPYAHLGLARERERERERFPSIGDRDPGGPSSYLGLGGSLRKRNPTHVPPRQPQNHALRGSASAFDLRRPTAPPEPTGPPHAHTHTGLGLAHHLHLWPRLTSSRSHSRLKPSTHVHSNSNAQSNPNSHQTSDTYQSLQVVTACDALVFPRPRLRPHAISPPDSPSPDGESPVIHPSEWPRVIKERATAAANAVASALENIDRPTPPPPQPSAYVRRVLAQGEQREREKREWAAAADRALLTRRRAKSVPGARTRLRAATVASGNPARSDTEGGEGVRRPSGFSSFWGRERGDGVGLVSRNTSKGSSRMTPGPGVGMKRERAESTPAVVTATATTTGFKAGHSRGGSGSGGGSSGGAGVERGGSLLRERGWSLRGRGERVDRHAEKENDKGKGKETEKAEEDWPVFDIRAGLPDDQPGPSLRTQTQPELRPPSRTEAPPPSTTASRPPDHTALHASLPPSPAPPIGLAVSTPPIHPHIPHPYATAFGSHSASRLPATSLANEPSAALVAGPHPSSPPPPVVAVALGDVERRHKLPPRAAVAPPLTATVMKPRVARVPVPSYPPAVPPVLARELESSDEGREFMSRVNSTEPEEEEVAQPKGKRRARGPGEWDEQAEMELLIAAGLNPYPTPEPGSVTPRKMAEPEEDDEQDPFGDTSESAFFTPSEGPYTAQQSAAASRSMLSVPMSMYANREDHRSAHTLASSNMLPREMRDSSAPRSPRSPPEPPFRPPSSFSGDERERFGEHLGYDSRESSPEIEHPPPPPLGGLDQIEAEMFKDLYWKPQAQEEGESPDAAERERDVEAQLNEARAARELARREREREREWAMRVELVDDGEDVDVEQLLPRFASPAKGYLRQPLSREQLGAGSSRDVSEERNGTERTEGSPLSSYEHFGHGFEAVPEEVRVGQVDELQVPRPTESLYRHHSIPLSVLESESTEVPSNPASPPGTLGRSFSPREQQHLSVPSTAYASEFSGGGVRSSHMTAVSMVTSNNSGSGNDRMSGLLSDFPQPPDDTVTPSTLLSSYFTPSNELDDYPLQMSLGESPMAHPRSLIGSDADSSPGSRIDRRSLPKGNT